MNTKCLLIAAVVGGSVLTAWGPSTAFGQCEITPVTVDDGVAKQKFGWSTAISGDYAVVGTDEPSSSTGAAYIYERDGLIWNKIGRLVPETILPVPPLLLANDDEYGRAVAISGRVAVVGARKRDIAGRTDQGAVYVFRRDDFSDEWVYQQELTALDRDAGDLFGAAVAIDGDWIVVGAPNNDDAGTVSGGNSGTAYVFHFDGSTWKQERKLRADDQAQGDIFGTVVSIAGNWVAVGAERDDDACSPPDAQCNSGSVYTFFHDPELPLSDWEETDKLTAQNRDGTADDAFNDFFGNSVSVSGDRLVVGARGYDGRDGAGDPCTTQTCDLAASGTAYVYRLEGLDWIIEQKLLASDTAKGDNFGRSVAIRGDLVLVGASKGDLDDPTPIEDTGSAYLYRRAGTVWTEESELTASDAASGDRFGQFVSIGGDYAAIGAFKKNDSKGAAYFFAVGTESDCDENGVHDDCDVLGDSSLDSNDNGVLDACECAIDDDCVGALECISGTCDSVTSLCVFTVNDDFCAIAGTCPAAGELNPDNDCEVCNPAGSDSDWSNRDQGLSCGDSSDTTCDHPDTCDGGGLCRTNPEPAGTDCADDGNECTNDQCDGAGDCGHPDVPDSTPCTPDGNDCTDNRCQSGQCSVLFLSNGMPCGDPFDSECNPADTCDGAGTCLDNVKDDDTSCADDGAFCTGEESCQGGFCESAGDPCTAEGLLCDQLAEDRNECSCDPVVEDVCDDDVFCTGEEICDDGVCFSPGDPCALSGQLCDEDRGECVACLTVDDCQDDGNDCTETVCRDGACEHDDLADNTPCGSDLDDDCTEPDTCAVGVCQANDEPAGTNCGDQSEDEPVCNPKDTCDGNGTCLDNIPPNDTPCADDGVFCSGPETCQEGLCTSFDEPCTAIGLICDATAEQNDVCSCDPAVESACDDGNECTIDECIAGACNHEAVPDFPVTACTDDGVFCNGVEICSAGECLPSGDPCEVGEVCSEDNNICNCDSNDDCAEDGLFCNGEEICSGGVCISAGDPCLANVTTPVCIEPTGSCECGTDLHCDDGKVCNGAETCVNGGCVDGADKCDSDQVCNEQENRCEECETGDDDDCNDGDNCTVDRCPFGMCVHEMLPECEDDDEDGVINAEDQCPGTPQDAQDDAIGCTCADAIDTDHDGVIDCNDECDDTPLRESADSSGCSCSQLTGDSDGDGVANACDDCAFTPSGEAVDGNGCGQSQIDSDQDGVMNDVDDCSGTPTGIEVGDDGCPLPVDNANDNEPGQDVPNDNGNDNDNTGDNDNDNTGDNDNDNTGDNDNGNTGDEPASRPCGLFGMINLVFLGLGMVAMRVTRGRHRRSRR